MKKIILRSLTILGLLLAVLLLTVFGFGTYYLHKYSKEAEQVKLNLGATPITQSLTILDANDQPLMQSKNEAKFTPPILSGDKQNVPDLYVKTLVAVEDKSFYNRVTKGYSLSGMFNAGFTELLSKIRPGTTVRGGSTIDQQVIKNVILGGSDADRTLSRKAVELIDAHAMAKKYTRNQILEAYMGSLRLTSDTIGVNAAWSNLFSGDFKQSKETPLYIAQIAYMAGLGQAPSVYIGNFNTAGKERADIVLSVMKAQKIITTEQYKQAVLAVKNQLKLSPSNLTGTPQAYQPYVAEVQSELKNLSLPSNSDIIVKTYTTKAQLDQLNLIANRQYNDNSIPNSQLPPGCLTGISVVDTATGHILGLSTNDATNPLIPMTAERSSGSTIKPLLDYAPALEYGALSTSSTMQGSSFTQSGWQVINYGGTNYGNVNIGFALGASLNTAAVQAYNVTSDQQKNSIMGPLGIGASSYEPVQAIGYNISTLQEASAYSALGNDGVRITPTAISSITVDNSPVTLPAQQSIRAMSSSTAQKLVSLLQNVTLSNGSEPLAAEPQWKDAFACKSGLTNFPDSASEPAKSTGSPDAWMAATTTGVSVSTWVGSPDMSGKYYVPAAPVEAENNMRVYLLNNTIKYMNANRQITPFKYSGSVLQQKSLTLPTVPTVDPSDTKTVQAFNPTLPTVPSDLQTFYNQHVNDNLIDSSQVYQGK